jgi:hypothetical protein
MNTPRTNCCRWLLPLIYEELRKLAASKLSREQPGQTLQPTMVVHEAYERPVDVERARPLFAAAAEAMRRILVEKAQRKLSQKHDGHMQGIDRGVATAAIENPVEDLLTPPAF